MHSPTHAPLLKRIIAASFCIALAIGSISIGLAFIVGYKLQITEVKNQLHHLHESQRDILTKNIWNFDGNAVQLQLHGMLSHPDIVYVELDMNGERYRVGDEAAVSKAGLHDSYKLSFFTGKRTCYLGDLHVYANLETAKNRVIYGCLMILAVMGGALLVTCFLVYSLFQRKFYRHLRNIVSFADTLDLNSLESRLDLGRTVSKRHVKDELELIVDALNDLRRRLREGLREKRLLQEDRTLLEKVVEQAGDAMLITDANWRIRYVNGALLKRMACSPETPLNRGLAEFLALSPAVLPYGAIRRTIVAGRTWSDHLFRKNSDGTQVEEDIALTAIQAGENDRSLFFVTVIKNVTREWALERQLLQAKKMESIGTLAGGIAHDFNNLLSVILGYADMVRMKYAGGNAGMQQDLGAIQKAGNRAKNLVKQILTFSRETEVQFRPLRLQSVIHEVHSMLLASLPATIILTVEMNEKDPPVFADAGQMHQVLMNLCTNAKHALPDDKGEIRIALMPVDIEPGNPQLISSLEAGRYLTLSIADNGCGMDEATKARIFDPFFTTKKTGEGTGLGLSVVHGIIKKHKGEITVASVPGEGTTFSIYLPVAEESLEDIPALSEGSFLGTERVMVLDDEELVGEMVEYSLTRLGYRVSRYTSPQVALDRFSENPDHYDVVITDMTMPVMTGDLFSRKVLAIRPDIPVIICTGYSETIDAKRAKKIGIRRFLMKPVIAGELAASIRQVLDAR